MEDEDLFFEDDVAEDQPAPKGGGKTGNAAPKASSKKTAASSAKPSATAQKAKAVSAEDAQVAAASTMNMTVAVLLMVITFLAGFVGGTVLERGRGGQQATVQAPPLTQQQIQGGQLPPGHVPVDAGTTPGGTGTTETKPGGTGTKPGGAK